MTIFRMHKVVVFALVLAMLGVLAFWVLITPDNAFTRLFRAEIADMNARVIVGPYPNERDFQALKANNVNTFVTLLDERLPYERVLIARERELAKKYNIKLLNFPMSSVLGQHFGANYESNAEAAAEAIYAEPGKVYLHCYLGIHRIKTVLDLLQQRKGVDAPVTGTFRLSQGERSQEARQLDKAQMEFERREYEEALATLKGISEPTLAARLLTGWSYYHLNRNSDARRIFSEILETQPDDMGALRGLGYCALRDNEIIEAEKMFSSVLKNLAQDASALTGMGLVRYRQGRLDEAAQALEESLRINANNEEARALLARIVSDRSGDVR